MKTKIIVASFFIVFAVFTLIPTAHAENYGLDITAKEAGLNTSRTAAQLIGNIIGAGLSFISVVFFALMIWGGLQWMLARGNDEQVKKAQNTIYGAVIGLIIVLASYALTNFVFQSVGPGQSSGGGGDATNGGTGLDDSGGGSTVCSQNSSIDCKGKSDGDSCFENSKNGICSIDFAGLNNDCFCDSEIAGGKECLKTDGTCVATQAGSCPSGTYQFGSNCSIQASALSDRKDCAPGFVNCMISSSNKDQCWKDNCLFTCFEKLSSIGYHICTLPVDVSGACTGIQLETESACTQLENDINNIDNFSLSNPLHVATVEGCISGAGGNVSIVVDCVDEIVNP